MTILTPSNLLSLMRGPLALLFIVDNAFYRSLAILLAMITDSLDGYLARRYRMTSQVGAFLDPLMDKLFVFIVIGIFIQEGRLQMWQALALLSRDFAVLVFGLYLALKGAWSNFQFRSIWSGKITTSLQFFILLALIFHISIPSYFFSCFIVLGFSALLELYFTEPQPIQQAK
ncbi:CDP-alcohol phosphatidyltransferase family protein [Candidatus Protochlamydia phocaeensis]|uniref:CDP-alcohol phosphatidyltransferase family protein n=1 Tax=Candidatus Protochlamydia phocaeensis TaxID=1414722 RepID=UPI001E51D9D4|nr:CDP-alcohol phosphatidyltransferase family protein [Candidatus Protochlamydia phocaeensis]